MDMGIAMDMGMAITGTLPSQLKNPPTSLSVERARLMNLAYSEWDTSDGGWTGGRMPDAIWTATVSTAGGGMPGALPQDWGGGCVVDAALSTDWEAVIVLAFWPFWRSGQSGGTSNLASDLAPIWRGPFWRESGRSGDRPVLATAPFGRLGTIPT